MATLADLVVKIGVDADRVRQGLSRVDSFFETHADKIAAAGAALGAGAGAAIGTGLSSAMEKEALGDKLAAQIGATGPEAARLGKVAGDLYSSGLGEGLEDVNNAIRGVIQNIDGMAAAGDADLKSVTAAVVNLGAAFDQDVGETSRAVGKMLKTGLAADATEALDILTRGFQTGANEADDLLDTFSEYSTQFRNMGLSGEQAMGIISQGLKAGARDADMVADTIKEFSIEAVAGGERVRGGFESLGLDADKMVSALAKGGPTAVAALDTVLDKLRGIKDPAERNAVAIELFGTKAEDMGDALYALDPSSAVQALGDVGGAADKLGKTLSDNAATGIESWRRKTEQALASMANAPGIFGETAQAAAGIGQVLLPMGSDLGGLAAAALVGGKAFSMVGKGAARAATAVGTAATSIVGNAAKVTASAVATGARWAATWAMMAARALVAAARIAASWFIAMGPVGWVITAVIALVALIIWKWDEIKKATQAAWNWIKEKTASIWNSISAWLGEKWNQIKQTATNAWNTLKTMVSNAWQQIRQSTINGISRVISLVRQLPGKIRNAVGNLGNLLYNAGRSVVTGLWNGIVSLGSWLYNQVMGWIKRVIPDPIERFLNISSPSKLMAKIGKNAALGLLDGMNQTRGLIAKGALGLGGVLLDAAGRILYAPDLAMDPYAVLDRATPSGASGGGGGPTVRLDIRSGGSQLDDLLVEVLRRSIRDRGGQVQAVLGSA